MNLSNLLSLTIFWINLNNMTSHSRLDFCSIFHSLITGVGSIICYPYNTILPYLGLSYSFYDIYSSILLKKYDFVIHGLLYFLFFFYLLYHEFYYPCNLALRLNISSIFLNLIRINKYSRAEIHKPIYDYCCKILFFVVFFYIRFINFTYNSYNYITLFYDTFENQIKNYEQEFLHFAVFIIGSLSITILNLYWLFIIFKKI